MHRLSSSFVLGYHGCDAAIAELLLQNHPFSPSNNVWDWLGAGIYFWEANPARGLQFASEVGKRNGRQIKDPTLIGAVLDLGFCLDLTTSAGLSEVKNAFLNMKKVSQEAGQALPENRPDGRHNLDCAVVNYVHRLRDGGDSPFDTVKGIFIEDPALYPGSAFGSKNHIQIAVRDPACIKGVFRVHAEDLAPIA